MKCFSSLLIALFVLVPTTLMASGDVIVSLKEESDGMTIGIESNSIYNSTVELPIVNSPDPKSSGVYLTFTDSDRKTYSLCAQINYSSMSEKTKLHYGHKVSVHLSFAIIKTMYCVVPGEYVVHGSYSGVHLNDERSAIDFKVLNVRVR